MLWHFPIYKLDCLHLFFSISHILFIVAVVAVAVAVAVSVVRRKKIKIEKQKRVSRICTKDIDTEQNKTKKFNTLMCSITFLAL